MPNSRRFNMIPHLEFSSRHLRVLFSWAGSIAAQVCRERKYRCQVVSGYSPERMSVCLKLCLSWLFHVGMSLGFSARGLKLISHSPLKFLVLSHPHLILLLCFYCNKPISWLQNVVGCYLQEARDCSFFTQFSAFVSVPYSASTGWEGKRYRWMKADYEHRPAHCWQISKTQNTAS